MGRITNEDWLRQRAFFIDFGLPEKNSLNLIGRAGKLLVSYWLSALKEFASLRGDFEQQFQTQSPIVRRLEIRIQFPELFDEEVETGL